MPKILIPISHKDKTLPSVMKWSKHPGKKKKKLSRRALKRITELNRAAHAKKFGKKRSSEGVQVWAQRMRDNPTAAEAILYYKLAGLGLDFHKQHIFGSPKIGHRIVDAYIPSLNVIIEADGEYHFEAAGIKRDEERARFFSKFFPSDGFFRYTNAEIMQAGFSSRLCFDILLAATSDSWPQRRSKDV